MDYTYHFDDPGHPGDPGPSIPEEEMKKAWEFLADYKWRNVSPYSEGLQKGAPRGDKAEEWNSQPEVKPGSEERKKLVRYIAVSFAVILMLLQILDLITGVKIKRKLFLLFAQSIR